MGPTLFFAERGDHKTMLQSMLICNGTPETAKDPGSPPCPVRGQCLEEQLARPRDEDNYGVFGGKTPNERHKIRSQRAVYKRRPKETVIDNYDVLLAELVQLVSAVHRNHIPADSQQEWTQE